MNSTSRKLILSVIIFSALTGCKPKDDSSESSQKPVAETKATEVNEDEEYIKAMVERLLFHAGNYNMDALDVMVSDNAMLGISRLKDGTWSNSEIAINIFMKVLKREHEALT